MEIKEYAPAAGQDVEVYLNLRRPGYWSIRDAKTKKVIAYAETILLDGVTFKVVPSGRKRTLEVEKMVHAWCRGRFVAADVAKPVELGRCINYNPHKAGHFYDVTTGEAVAGAAAVHMSNRKVWSV